MGQQQLLLLVLGIVIVGLSVVVGIQAFGENQKKANADALVNDAVRIASDAQAWKLKPAAFGGGAAVDLSTLQFSNLGYKVNEDGDYENLNGTFELSESGSGVLITAKSPENSNLDNTVYVRVCGTSTGDITTVVNGTAPEACS